MNFFMVIVMFITSFSVSTLLVERQEGIQPVQSWVLVCCVDDF